MIFNGEPFMVLTHFDTDGAGGPILLKDIFGDQVIGVKPCGYGKITNLIERNVCDNVIITDLSLTQEQINRVNVLYKNVKWFDHHKTSLGLEYPKHWFCLIKTPVCATKLIYLWLGMLGYDVTKFKEFVQAVNDYDVEMWNNVEDIYED